MICAALVIALAGCASQEFNDALTPSVELIKDDFDGTLILRQKPVGATSSMSEPVHTLGFEWLQKDPDRIYVTAGVFGTHAVIGVAFNADGFVMKDLERASYTTSFKGQDFYRSSSSRFVMTWVDFLRVANARSVKMRVSRINDYATSSFGPDHPGAIVNTKLAPFVAQVQALRAAKK